MNLCFVCPEYPPGPHGGVGTFTQVMARGMVQLGHQVRVAGVYPSEYPAPAYEEDRGVRVWRIPEPATRFGWIRARFELYRLIRSWVVSKKCDLVESPDCYGWIAGWPRMPIPLVLRAHGSLTYYAHELRQRVSVTGHMLEAWAYRRADAWVSVSEYTGSVTARLFKLENGPNAVLYNPIDAPSVSQFEERDPGKVVFTGTLTRKKGVISLCDAWPMIKRRFAQAELHLYGKDGDVESGETMQSYLLKRLPEEFHSSVKFHGHVSRPEVTRALSTAHTAVFPSYVEAFAMAPLEAMASGCPTIYSKRGSGPELIEHEHSGLLVDPDSPNEIADCVVRILADDPLARRLGNNGRRQIQERFTTNRILTQNEAFFSRVIHSFHRSELLNGAILDEFSA